MQIQITKRNKHLKVVYFTLKQLVFLKFKITSPTDKGISEWVRQHSEDSH